MKNNRNNADVIRALRILKRRECGMCVFSFSCITMHYSILSTVYYNVTGMKQWSTLNPINSQTESDSECEENDGSTDFVDDNVNIHFDPIIRSTLHNTYRLDNNENNKTNLDYKSKMHRVIQIKMDNKQHK